MEGATRVYGDSRASWFKDGRYFTADWVEVSIEDAALPEPVIEEPQPPPSTEVYSYARAPESVLKVRLDDVGCRAEGTISYAEKKAQTREERLAAMPTFTIAALVKHAGGEPAKGKGSRAENIAWLIAHTSDG